MKTRNFLLILALVVIVSAFGQNTIELTFTAIDSTDFKQLDSIKVMNRTQGGDTVLFYPDTVLVLDYQVGISEFPTSTKGFQLFQNYPNPVRDQTTVSFYLPERDKVSLIITGMLGRALIKTERILDQGCHSFCFTPGNSCIYLFTVQWKGNRNSIKILQTNSISNDKCQLDYIGSEGSSLELKATDDLQSFLFNLGDELLYIGYYDTLQSGMMDKPEESGDFTFQFAYNIPCLGTPTVEYEGQVYNTIQIYDQCWFKENLNVGAMISGSQAMSNNGIIEKYCYNNEPDSCIKYGGLYQWEEMMDYTISLDLQGICPTGWHIPTNEEWKILEGAVDSQYSIGDSIWDISEWRGFNVAYQLKSDIAWPNGNGNNTYDFCSIPSGCYIQNNGFSYLGNYTRYWTSNEGFGDYGWIRLLGSNTSAVYSDWDYKVNGFSIRCIKN